MTETLEQIALRIAEDINDKGYKNMTEYTVEFAKRLVEALDAQEPITCEYKGINGQWKPFIDKQHKEATMADGAWEIRELYAAPKLGEVK